MVVEWIHTVLENKKKNPRSKESKVSKKQGYYWVFNPMRVWYGIFPQIPERTLRRVFERLEAIDLLKTGVFNKYKATRTKWYRINYKYRIKTIKSIICKRLQSGDWAIDWIPFGHGGQMVLGQGGQMHMATVAKSRHVTTIHETSNMSAAPPPTPHSPKKGSKSVEDTMREYNMTRLPQLKEKLSKKATVAAAVEFWQLLMSMYGVGTYLSLTKKERGLMKNLVSLLTRTGGDIAEFLEFCVQNWDDLRAKITWPDQPKKSRLGTHPYFQELFFAKEDLLREWENWSKEEDVKTISLQRIESVEDIPEGLSSEEKQRLKDQIEILGYAEVENG
jgi:hypothetical protein